MKFLPLAIAVIFSICILHCTAQQSESTVPEDAGFIDLQIAEMPESDKQEGTDDVDLKAGDQEHMIYTAERSELPRLRAKRRIKCRFCCRNRHCGVCCSF